jgi:Zn-dependent protease
VKAHGLGEQAALVLAILVSVAIHEAGHALTLRHFGATVRRAGFGWYWFAPVAFVDTSDAYALPRAKRIAVSLAGPFASLIVAGCAGLFAAFVHVRSAESIAWSLAAFTYIATLWNFNPLLELDGYYVLTDLLQRPNLRRDGFMALSGRRRDSVAFAYALGALAYGATVVFVAIPSLARMTIVALLPATAAQQACMWIPIVAAVLAFLAVAHSHRSIVPETIRSWRSSIRAIDSNGTRRVTAE